MEFFKWKAEYSVKIDKIDDQHKKLLEIINELYRSFVAKTDEDKIGIILESLVDYTNYHFNTEEKLFKNSGYLEEYNHLLQHQSFVNKLVGFIEEFRRDKSAVTYKLMNFLRNWLINHIQKEDQKYSQHLLKYFEVHPEEINK